VPDPAHSLSEQRFIAVGRTPAGRPVFIAVCFRGVRIRPISARYMHAREWPGMPRSVPTMTTYEEAETFLDQDLSDLDFTAFKPSLGRRSPRPPASTCACRSG
jgi:hypothetical protein